MEIIDFFNCSNVYEVPYFSNSLPLFIQEIFFIVDIGLFSIQQIS